MRYCRQCGEQLPDESRFCTGCGTNITGIDNEKDMKANEIGNLPTETMPAAQIGKASKLGSAVPEQQAASSMPANTTKGFRSGKSKKIIPIIILAIILLGVGAWGWQNYVNLSEQKVQGTNIANGGSQSKQTSQGNNIAKSESQSEQTSQGNNVYYEDFTKSISSNWDTNTRGVKLLRDDKLGIALGGFNPWTHGPLMPFYESAFPLGSHYTIEADIMLKGEDEYKDQVGFTFSYHSVRGESNDGNIYLKPAGNKTHLLISDLSLSHQQPKVSYNTGEFAHLSVVVDGDLLIVSLNGQNVMESSSASWDKIRRDEHFHPGLTIFGNAYIKNIKIERLD